MFSFVLMKVLESSPKRYDAGMNLISFGRVQKIKRHIVNNYVLEGEKVLDIGCGTATLSIMMAEKGAWVEGFDPAPQMLSIARDKIASAGLTDRIHLVEMGVAQMDTRFLDESFDKVVSTLVFSELSNDEQHYALRECKRILKKNS